MWSNISAPKSALKAAKVGQQQVKQDNDEPMEQQENNQELLSTNFNDHNQNLGSGSPLMRYKHAVCSSPNSGFIYIHGGRFANGVPLDDDLWRFDAHENCWLQLKTSGCKPPSLQEHTLSEYKDHLYMFGGQVSAASGQEDFFWRLDLAKRQWVSLNLNAANCSSLKYGARLGPTNRRGHSACIYRDSIYIFGGYEDFRGSTNQLWQYDLLNERWELRNLSSSSACHPEPRHNHSAIIYQDEMYIYGGLSNLKPLGDLWRWSWRDKRWFREKTRGQSPGQLHGHSAIQAFGSMFVFGGERQNGRTTRSLWRLNLSNLCWKKIKPRGPRPNPTTWHAAIANPLGVLDQANYLIEGETSDLEQELTADEQQQSMSDTHYNPTSMQQTIPMESIRPAMMTTDDRQQTNQPLGSINQHYLHHHHHHNHHQQQSQKNLTRLKVSRSSSEQMSLLAKQTAGQSRDRVTKSKRRLRLSFLRRNKKQSGEARQLPTSFSATSILTSSINNSKQLPSSLYEVVKQDSVSDLAVKMEDDVEMLNVDKRNKEQNGVTDTNLAILDNLDTDIKQMFHRADLSSEHLNEDQSQRQGSSVAMSRKMARDSMTQSQLSASLAPTITQTYQTAREHFSSQSTTTITAPASESRPKFSELASGQVTTGNKLADVKQRKSMHLINASQLRRNSGHNHDQGHSRQQTRGRPKSEIVQSLIDRADARIKNACMPLFNPDNNSTSHQNHDQQRHRFGSNELSILGELANHPMFERSSDASQRRHLLDKSKRHTIHQTMTYYNLYFAEERQGGDSSSSPPSADSATERQVTENGESGKVTLEKNQSNGGNDKSLTSNNANSLTAALVGVRDGGSSSGGDLSQRTTTLGRLESEVGSLMQSSDSRTLCNNLQDDPKPAPGQHFEQTTRQNGFGLNSADKFAGSGEFDDTADNTSLSFSVIAEFEEDDMLQYSSPTTLDRMTNGREEIEQDQHDDQDDDDDDDFEENARAMDDLNLQNSSGIRQDAIEFEEVKTRVMVPQKSTSSGYDSIRSNQWSSCNGQQLNQQQQLQQHQLASYSASSNGGDSPLRTSNNSPNDQFNLSQQSAKEPPEPMKSREQEIGQTSVAMSTTTASSTTAESFALTTTNDTSDCCPLTPPSKSLPSSPPHLNSSRQLQQHCQQQRNNSSSFASSLMSGPSRLFGKRRAKTRYWQLCMFVIGGKQQGGQHNTGNLNEPITIWRLYI